MKTRYALIAVLFLSCSIASFAQGRRDKIRSLKVAFITDALSLTPTEAEKFWPLYNAFEDRQFEIRKQKFRSLRDRFESNPESLTDKEALSLLTDMDETEEQLHDARKKFSQSLRGVLSPVKILKLRKAEDDFNRRLLRQYRNKE